MCSSFSFFLPTCLNGGTHRYLAKYVFLPTCLNGPSLQASPHYLARKGVIVVPRMFEKTSSQPTWSKKEAAENSKSGIATSTEGNDDKIVQENLETMQEDITSVMESEFCGIDSSLKSHI